MQGSGSKRLILHCRSCSTSAETPTFKQGPSGCSVFLFLFVIMISLTFLVFEREGKRERDRETERQRDRVWVRKGQTGGDRIVSMLHVPSCQHRAGKETQTPNPWGHDLNWSQMLNQLSHPGAPVFLFLIQVLSLVTNYNVPLVFFFSFLRPTNKK